MHERLGQIDQLLTTASGGVGGSDMAAQERLGGLVCREEGPRGGQRGDDDDADALIQSAEQLPRGRLGLGRGVREGLQEVLGLLPCLQGVEGVDEQVDGESRGGAGLGVRAISEMRAPVKEKGEEEERWWLLTSITSRFVLPLMAAPLDLKEACVTYIQCNACVSLDQKE